MAGGGGGGGRGISFFPLSLLSHPKKKKNCEVFAVKKKTTYLFVFV